eukprot:g10302.t1
MNQLGRHRQRVLPRGFSEEESSTVIVGQSAPSLEDILNGNSTEQPFDLASFMVFAERRLFSEAVAFLLEVTALRAEKNLHLFHRRLRHIVSEFVSEDGCRQVNLSDGVRRATERHVATVLDRLTKSPFSEPDRSSLDSAYWSVLKLVRDDQYPKYMDYILVQRQLRFSRMEAQWWKNESLTVQEFFKFPSPVDAIESRLHATMTILVSISAALVSALLGFPWVWLYLTYGFLARCLCGPRVDPQAFLVLFVLRPLVAEKLGPLRDEFLPGAPMRFAQFVGLVLSSGCTVAAFVGRFYWMLGLVCVLVFFSFLWSACNTCVICVMYLACVRAKLLPASICNDCSIRYIKGEGPPMKMTADLITDRLYMSNNSKSSSMSSSVRGGGGGGGGVSADGNGDIGGGRRSATPSLSRLKGRSLGRTPWRLSPGQEEEREGSGEETKGGDMLAASGVPLTQSRRAVLEEVITEGDDEGDDGGDCEGDGDDDDDANMDDNEDPTARPKSLSARNLLSFSKDITGLAATLAARRPASRKLRRTRVLADLEDYNNLFSRRLSRRGMHEAAGVGGVVHGHQGHDGAPSVGSRTTSRTNSCRTVSDLDIEPAADVEQTSPPSSSSPSEDMSVDDENDFGSSGSGGGGPGSSGSDSGAEEDLFDSGCEGGVRYDENGFGSTESSAAAVDDVHGFRFRRGSGLSDDSCGGRGGDDGDASDAGGGGGGGDAGDEAFHRVCDDCLRKKKKCDGSMPCSRCRRKNGHKCVYSKRKPHRPPESWLQQQRTAPAGMHAGDTLRHSASGAPHGMLPFKRCRFSASPATGLVGMQENAFLSDFFGCVGFMPLTTQSQIRETMVNIMALPEIRQSTGDVRGGDFCEAAEVAPGAITAGEDLSTALGARRLPVDPSKCMFWCAVALGALVKGFPVESVAAYCRLASDALGTYSGPPNLEVAKAWTILTHLHSFMGNKTMFQQYLKLSRSFLDASLEQGPSDTLPVGFAEMIQHTETVKVCFGYAEPGEIEEFCAHRLDPPQLIAAADEREIYRYVMQSFRVFEQSVHAKACEKSAACGGRPQDDAEDREADHSDDSGTNKNGNGDGNSDSCCYLDEPLLSEVSGAMAAGLRDHVVAGERLEEAADRPSIRKGIGGLLINASLVFNEAFKGNVDGTLERLARCVEVYERYPGLCRCILRWDNIAHVSLAALAALDDARAGELYGRLRAAYNPHRPPGWPPVPPLEEWQGVHTFCEDFYCRTFEGLITGGFFSVFSAPLDAEGKERGANAPLAYSEGNHFGVSMTPGAPEEIRDPISVGPHGGGAELSETAANSPSSEVGRATLSAPQHCDEQEIGPEKSELGQLTRGGYGGSDDLIGAPEPRDVGMVVFGALNDETGDGGVTAADWLDVTLAMLGDATDDPGVLPLDDDGAM